MSDVAEARELAFELPEATEQDHHGMASFRIRGKIFATLPDDDHLRVILDEAEINDAVAEYPTACAKYYWGKPLACVVVSLTEAPGGLLRELLTEAWLRKAPQSLVREFHPSQ